MKCRLRDASDVLSSPFHWTLCGVIAGLYEERVSITAYGIL